LDNIRASEIFSKSSWKLWTKILREPNEKH
jgi:hypothetical protein